MLLAATGVTVLSVDALLIRLAAAPAADIAFWRGLFIALSLTLVFRVRRRRWAWTALLEGGPPAAALIVGFGLMQLCFVGAISNTRVANAVVILTAAPLFAAAFSGVFLREWVPLRTWLAIGIALVGIVVVFGGSLGLGHWLGDLIALGGSVVVGANYTMLRRTPDLSRLAAVAGGGLVCALLIAPAAQPLSLDARSMTVLAVMGLVQMPLALVLMTEATRYLPAAEATLFFIVEAILGTFWVWLILSEQPPPLTLVGGTLVIATLVLHSWMALRKHRAA
ncbi:MAG: DMT family transporter [Gammaproteobacteria bacterium]|nr:DMT family transporter [Gammaproteobacteria bacterium]